MALLSCVLSARLSPDSHLAHLSSAHANEVRAALCQVIFNRLVLLSELDERAIAMIVARHRMCSTQHLSIPTAAAAARQQVDIIDMNDRRRYLPEGAGPEGICRSKSWNDNVSILRPPSWTWLDVISANGIISASAIAMLYEEVHDPQFISRVNAQRPSHLHLPSMSQKLTAAGIDHFSSDEKPTKRIKQSNRHDTSLPAAWDRHWRFPGHLAIQQSVTVMVSSIKGSWKSSRSGILAFALFMQEHFPFHPHFPQEECFIIQYLHMFRNGDTLDKYLGHIRLANKIMNIPTQPLILPDVLAQHLRAAKKTTIRHPAPPVSAKQCKQLCVNILQQHTSAAQGVALARIIAIVFHFMLRAADELFPLQIQGHHSCIILDKHQRRNRATIKLAHRKNHPRGDEITRTCICNDQPSILCGTCSLLAQVEQHAASGRSSSERLFDISASLALVRIKTAATSVGIEKLSWHSFRRGSAHHMLDKGATIAQILRAGGWRSAAFLRYLCRKDVDNVAHLQLIHDDSDSD